MPKKKIKKGADVWKNRIVKYGEIDLSQALANPHNWRVHPYEQAQALEGVLDEVGIVQNVLVNLRTSEKWPRQERNVETFIDGHLRATRAMGRGVPTLPATYVDLDPNEERMILLSLDSIGGMAKSDEEQLRILFEQVKAEDEKAVAFLEAFADDYGMTLGGEKKEITDVPPPIDQAVELMKKWGVQEGDLWGLGEHRLICGDSSDPVSVRRLLEPGGVAVYGALMSTDAPYLVDYFGDARSGGGKDWSDLYEERGMAEDPLEFLLSIFRAWVPYVREDAAWFLWHASRTRMLFEAVMEKLGLFVHEEIIWAKPTAVMSYAKYCYRHEPCLFGWKKGHQPHMRLSFFGAKNSTVWTEWFDASRGLDEVLMFVEEHGTLWAVDFAGKKRPSKNMHPTEKPIELFARPMRNHTRTGDVCFEPFSGSGSQILAGEKTGRVVYASERQPAFVAVAIERYKIATGNDPILIERGSHE